VSYFAATLSRTSAGWSAADLDLDDVESLDDLVDLAVTMSYPGGPEEPDATVVLVEQEDEWFAVVRADPDDPRVFVSDAPAALRHALGELLLPELVPDVSLSDVDVVATGSADAADGPDVAAATNGTEQSVLSRSRVGLHDAAGDPELLADLGVPEGRLTELAGAQGPAPGVAVAAIADLLGCTAALDAVR
jgi:putative tRNA adenosine deaminase-associated protein